MNVDDAYLKLAKALHRAEVERDELRRKLAELEARFAKLVEVMIAREQLGAGHERLLARVGEHARQEAKPRVRLRVLVDKYGIENNQVNCAERIPVCGARCCSFQVELTSQDVQEGKLAWDVENPYVLKRNADGYCMYFDKETCGCGVYDHRPASCRGFSCAYDKRLWDDFDNMTPAPMPEGLELIKPTRSF